MKFKTILNHMADPNRKWPKAPRLNTVPYKVVFKICGSRHIKGHKTREDAERHLEIVRAIDPDARIVEKFV